MKKLLVAITAALGLAAASVPASAGSSWSVTTGYYSAPTYSYAAPAYTYVAPSYSYVAPRYYAPAPVVSFSFGNSYYKPYSHPYGKRHYRGKQRYNRHNRHGYRHHW